MALAALYIAVIHCVVIYTKSVGFSAPDPYVGASGAPPYPWLGGRDAPLPHRPLHFIFPSYATVKFQYGACTILMYIRNNLKEVAVRKSLRRPQQSERKFAYKRRLDPTASCVNTTSLQWRMQFCEFLGFSHRLVVLDRAR